MLTKPPTDALLSHTPLARRMWALLGVTLIYLYLVAFKPISHSHLVFFADIVNYVVPGIAAFWVFGDCWRSRNVFAPDAPRKGVVRWWVALFFGLATFCYAIGSYIWADYELRLHQPSPFPSWADAAYIFCYPFLFAGVLRISSRPISPPVRWRLLMDSCMIMTALVTFSWYFVLGPILLAGSETTLGMILGLAYPICDLIALFCLLMVTTRADEAALRRPVLLLAFGIIGFVSANIPFAYLTLHNAYISGRITDIGWVLGWGMVAIGGAELLQNPSVERTSGVPQTILRSPILWRAMAPYAFVPCVGALIVYILRLRASSTLEVGVYVGSTLLIGFVLLRQVLSILENSDLNRRLRTAYTELEEKNRQLQNLATTDGMTGLSNHRDFQERLRIALSDAARHETPLSLLLLDVDHFKLFNDTFGHPSGDEVLRALAAVLRGSIREGDLAARYGGEEFALLLPGSDSAQASATAERIRVAINTSHFPHRHITVSIGVTDTQIAGLDPEALISSADTALYAAKRGGRDRWVIAGDAETLFSAA